MAMYRCAACGSSQVAKGDMKAGYSFTKGAIGVAVFGAVGAVAGLDGKKQDVYHCSACGMSMSHPMDDLTKMTIDDCVRSVESRNHHDWAMLQYRYPNIESGAVDSQIATHASSLQTAMANVIAEHKGLVKKFQSMSPEELDAEQNRWLEKESIFLAYIKNKEAEWEQALPERLKDTEDYYKNDLRETKERLEVKINQRKALEQELASVKGLFKGKVKDEIKAKIAEQQRSIDETQSYLSKHDGRLREALEKAKEKKLFIDKFKVALMMGLTASPYYLCGVKPSNLSKTRESEYAADYAIGSNVMMYILAYKLLLQAGPLRKKEFSNAFHFVMKETGLIGMDAKHKCEKQESSLKDNELWLVFKKSNDVHANELDYDGTYTYNGERLKYREYFFSKEWVGDTASWF